MTPSEAGHCAWPRPRPTAERTRREGRNRADAQRRIAGPDAGLAPRPDRRPPLAAPASRARGSASTSAPSSRRCVRRTDRSTSRRRRASADSGRPEARRRAGRRSRPSVVEAGRSASGSTPRARRVALAMQPTATTEAPRIGGGEDRVHRVLLSVSMKPRCSRGRRPRRRRRRSRSSALGGEPRPTGSGVHLVGARGQGDHRDPPSLEDRSPPGTASRTGHGCSPGHRGCHLPARSGNGVTRSGVRERPTARAERVFSTSSGLIGTSRPWTLRRPNNATALHQVHQPTDLRETLDADLRSSIDVNRTRCITMELLHRLQRAGRVRRRCPREPPFFLRGRGGEDLFPVLGSACRLVNSTPPRSSVSKTKAPYRDQLAAPIGVKSASPMPMSFSAPGCQG